MKIARSNYIVFIVVISALEEIYTTEILQVLIYFDSPLTTIQGKDLSNKVFPPELGNKVKILQKKVAAYTYQINRSECLHFTFINWKTRRQRTI